MGDDIVRQLPVASPLAKNASGLVTNQELYSWDCGRIRPKHELLINC